MSSFEDAGSTWALVIDTDGYAGNYERQLTAFCTGRIGECEVGEEHVARFQAEENPNPFPMDDDDEWVEGTPDILHLMDDDDGCRRPCAIHTSPNWFNDGIGHHYRVDDHPPEAEMIDVHEAADVAHYERSSHPDDRERNVQRARDHAAEMRANGKINRYPAYMSVAIYFDRRPSDEQIAVIRRRAETFFAEGLHDTYGSSPDAVHVEGFRLIERRMELVEHDLSQHA